MQFSFLFLTTQFSSVTFRMCPCRYFGEGTCRFGDKCSQAHSDAELEEWKERFEYKKRRMQKAKENDLQSNTYAEQLLKDWMNAENPESVVRIKIQHAMSHSSRKFCQTLENVLATKRL